MFDEGPIIAIGAPEEINRNPNAQGYKHFLNGSISRGLSLSSVESPVGVPGHIQSAGMSGGYTP